MARKRKKQRPGPEPFLDEIDRFLEDGVDGLSPAERRRLEEEGASRAFSEPAPSSPETKAEKNSKPTPRKARPQRLELILLEDGLKAVVRVIHPGSAATEILDLLEQHSVSFGIDKPAILKAVDTARQTGQSLRDVVVARGKPAQPPPPPRIEFRLPDGWDTLPVLDPIRRLLLLQDREELTQAASTVQTWAVRPGDCLGAKIVSAGKEGVDVEGQPIPVPDIDARESSDPRLKPGQGVRLAPNGVDYEARVCGYAGLENGQITVLEPVWISSDSMEACFLKLPTVNGYSAPAPEDLRILLKTSGVSSGIDEKAISSLCEHFAQVQDPLFTLARGIPPEPPVDAVPTFSLDLEFRAGTFRPDGSVDFRERNIFPPVKKDARLASVAPPAPGRPGRNVHGEELPVPDPARVELVPGENVRLENEDDTQLLYATADGGATLKTQTVRSSSGAILSIQHAITVQPAGRIDGDVGYDTGNIDFQGNVEISGSINGGFRVRATGDVVVSGSVEAGAEIQAGGDLLVRQGIVGRQTSIHAAGSVSAKFVHDASIQADGDVLIGSYLHGAQVQSGGQVHVEGLGGADNSGGIIGGCTWARKGIVARNIGSERSTSTQLFAGMEPDQQARFQKIGQTIRQAELMLQKLLEAIDLPALKADEIRKLVARNPTRRSSLLHYVKKANQLAQVRQKHVREQRELAEQIDLLAQEAVIDVPDQAFARTALHIGSLQLVLTGDLHHVRFATDPENDRIDQQNLP